MPKQLEIKIRKNGFDYEQVHKSDKGFVYAQISNNKVIAYEAFLLKVNSLFDYVSFPGNEAFGKWAWTVRSIDEGIKKIQNA